MGSLDSLDQVLFNLKLEIAVGSFSEFQRHLAAALSTCNLPDVVGFESPMKAQRAKRPPKSPEASVAKLVSNIDKVANDPTDVAILFSQRSFLYWGQRPDKKSFAAGMFFAPSDGAFEDPNLYVPTLTDVTRALLSREILTAAVVERIGDAGACVPFVPIAATRRPLVLTSDEEVANEYDRPDDFWSGWTVERFGRRKLVTRLQAALSRGEVLKDSIDHQWQMARAAKPARAAYSDPTVSDAEQETFEDGDAKLELVGVSSDGSVEYSCSLEPGEHICGYEIYYVRELLQKRQFRDGKPVREVRVVFYERSMAEREKRPLLDNGARVFYDTADGDPVELLA